MVTNNMDAISWLRKRREDSDSDFIREMVEELAAKPMSADASGQCDASYGERTVEQINSRNGYRERAFDARVSTVALDIPELMTGSYFPDWLVAPRQRADRKCRRSHRNWC